jgi:hypothetical protein
MCHKHIIKDKIPTLSVAAGIDFGVSQRIKELTKPNFAEESILARMRLFEQVIKIRSNTSGTKNYTHYKIQGHSVIFAHDAAERYFEAATDLITKDRLETLFSILFVGPDGKMDWLIKKTGKSSTIFARPYVIIQWLLLLNKLSIHYKDIPQQLYDPSKWEEIGSLLQKANQHIIDTADRVTDEEEISMENSLGADIAVTSRIPHGHQVEEEHANDPSREEAAVPLRYSLVTNRELPQPYDICKRQQLEALPATCFVLPASCYLVPTTCYLLPATVIRILRNLSYNYNYNYN